MSMPYSHLHHYLNVIRPPETIFVMFTNRMVFLVKCFFLFATFYLFLYVVSLTNPSHFIRELQQSGRNLASLDSHQNPEANAIMKNSEEIDVVPITMTKIVEISAPKTTTVKQPNLMEKVKEITRCLDKSALFKVQQRGDYWVFYNYVKADRIYLCHESITYTTHADYSFLDNVLPLLDRWQGPVSIALHAPGTDFQATMDSISYLRDCTSPLVKELVTFHIYFSTKHIPTQIPRQDKLFMEPYNCSLPAPYQGIRSSETYKSQKKLLYPVNVGRNVARETALTHFILPSDIELYPSPDIIPKFLEMIAENKGPLLRKNHKVFPLHLFEVSENQMIPDNKTTLMTMLKTGKAVPFHKKLCAGCHNVPKSKEWQMAPETEGLHIFHVGKRMGYFVHWEPIFIGTHAEPLYDERLSWEGKSDKMTQGYALCVLDYDFLILDNAFLVHKPGIKTYKKDQNRAIIAARTSQLIKKVILPELKVVYGVKKGCAV